MVIKKFLTGLLVVTTPFLWAQPPAEIINSKETGRIINVLAADEMRGRRVFTPEIDKAAEFIAAEFKTAGLQPFKNTAYFRQEFSLVRPRLVSVNASMDGLSINAKNIIVITCQANLEVNEKSGYESVKIKAGANLQTEARKCIRANRNIMVLVDKSFVNSFGNLSRLKSTMFKTKTNVLFVLTDTEPQKFSIQAVHAITEQKMANVVGVLPGKKTNEGKAEEYIVFSGHYDHLGTGRPVNGDSVFNGANDDAAGITAVIMLAKYFKALNKNERTLIFVAFTAEEVGGYGSQYFSQQIEPEKIMAMFNIEMIGTESKWGKNSAYITGHEKTNMGAIMTKDLEGTGFIFYPDPYPQQQLFYRSDNATLARLGVPAHTISTSKMDTEPHYHQLTDHVETLDLDNMTQIIKAIAASAESIIKGKATPSRVKVDELR